MKIISVSRRTDVAGFYSEWFMNRIREGYVRWANPFSKAIYNTSLRSEDVMALVFVSKNYLPMLLHLDDLDHRGYKMLFHFTINGLPKAIEPRVPDADLLISAARKLSARYGPEAVLWRYDPIIISNVTNRDYHVARFAELSSALEGTVRRCYFSFTKFYRKVERNLRILREKTGIIAHDLPIAERQEIAAALADIASEHGIEMHTCSGDYLVSDRIKKAHCVDGELLHRLYPDKVHKLNKLPSRQDCGCCQCTDIGAYDTCPHGCVYCYANTNPTAALRNYREHNPAADILGSFDAAQAPTPQHSSTLELPLSAQ